MNIAFTFDQLNRCGGVRVPFEYCRELTKLGHTAEIYSNSVDSSIEDWKTRYGVNLRPLSALPEGHEVVISCWWPQIEEIAQKHPKKLFHLVQGRDYLSYPPDHAWIETNRVAMHRDDVTYLAVSQWAGESCKDPIVIPNGIDTNFWRPIPFTKLSSKFRILLEASTGDKYKGMKEALEIVEKVKMGYSDIEVWWITTNPEPSKLVDRIIEKPDDLAILNAYQNCDVLLKTTHFDGFGLPHLEAMACGLPLVTTRAGGNEEFCIDELNCLMMNVGDIYTAVNHLSMLHDDKQLRKNLAVHGLETAKSMSWEDSATKLVEVIK